MAHRLFCYLALKLRSGVNSLAVSTGGQQLSPLLEPASLTSLGELGRPCFVGVRPHGRVPRPRGATVAV